MNAQDPDGSDEGRARPYPPSPDGEPVDPYVNPYQGRQLPPPPPPHSAAPPPVAPTPYDRPGQGGQPGYPPYGQHGYPPYGQWNRAPYGYRPYAVAAKSPGLALLASFFIPGLGSMINGEIGKGVGILVGYLVSAVLTVVLIGIVGMLVFWIWGMVDGYSGAQRWNARHGILS